MQSIVSHNGKKFFTPYSRAFNRSEDEDKEQEESHIIPDSDLERQRAIEHLIESYSGQKNKNVVKARVQEKKRSVENLVIAQPRSRISSVTDLRYEEKRVVTPLDYITFTIGDLPNIDEELMARGFYLSSNVRRISGLIKNIPIELQRAEFGLFRVEDISPKRVSSPAEFFAQAETYGYGKCHPETGKYARLFVPEKEHWEKVCIGMDPIIDSDGSQVIFCIKQTGTFNPGTYKSLGTIRADSGYQGAFSPKEKILLRRFSK